MDESGKDSKWRDVVVHPDKELDTLRLITAHMGSSEPLPNYDAETGIHYGVIPSRDVAACAVDDVIVNGTDLAWEETTKDATDLLQAIVRELLDNALRTSSAEERKGATALKAYVDSTLEDDALEHTSLASVKHFGGCVDAAYVANLLAQRVFDSEAITWPRCWTLSLKTHENLLALLPDVVDDDALALVAEELACDMLDYVTDRLWVGDSRGTIAYDDTKEGWTPRSTISNAGSYRLLLCTDDDIFVTASNFYTYAAPCSPCAPLAGYLKSSGQRITYCLGGDWFDLDPGDPHAVRIPYQAFRVSDAVPVHWDANGVMHEGYDPDNTEQDLYWRRSDNDKGD